MNLLSHWMQSDWSKALGWTFVHSLWQIAAIGLILYIVLRLIPGRSAHVRYTISTMAIWMIVLMALSTFIIMLPESKPVSEFAGQLIVVKVEGGHTLAERISMWLESRMPMMLSIWLGGVIILMLRLAFSLAWVQHMRTTSTPHAQVQQTVNKLIHKLRLRINPLASESGFVSSPVTIGHLKPVILFPIGIINQLTPQEVEAVLTHELAHIVRRDYLSNLIQSFIETLFYYHPVTWWISNKVRTERENRADDLAISWCGDHLGYVKALITVQEMELGASPGLAIGFASGKDAMLTRIQRILHIPYKNHNQMEKAVLLSLCSIFFFGFTLNSHTTPENKMGSKTPATEIVNVVATIRDSVPSQGTYTIHKKTDDKDISIRVKDGDIKELKIDGKEIAPDQFDQYDLVISELFGEMDAPPSMEDFTYTMPAMPAMPSMPSMNYNYSYTMPAMPPMPGMPDMPAMPGMPDMPPMPDIRIGHLFGEGINLEGMQGMELDHLMEGSLGNLMMLSDTSAPGTSKIIIIRDGDSTIIMRPSIGMNWSEGAPAIAYGYNNIDKEAWKEQEKEWKEQEKAWKEQSKEWKQNWEENAAQWRNAWREQQESMKDEQEHMRNERQMQLDEREHMRDEDQMKRDIELRVYGLNDRAMDQTRAAEELERHLAQGSGGETRVYGFMAPSPRMGMTESMVEEGLVSPGEEADVVLTPDKLKINGKKMPDEVHQKYLSMYERQQGVELSGKSRVEFKTKSRRTM